MKGSPEANVYIRSSAVRALLATLDDCSLLGSPSSTNDTLGSTTLCAAKSKSYPNTLVTNPVPGKGPSTALADVHGARATNLRIWAVAVTFCEFTSVQSTAACAHAVLFGLCTASSAGATSMSAACEAQSFPTGSPCACQSAVATAAIVKLDANSAFTEGVRSTRFCDSFVHWLELVDVQTQVATKCKQISQAHRDCV